MNPLTKQFVINVCGGLEKAANLTAEDTNKVRDSEDPIELVKHLIDLREVNEMIKKARETLQKLEDQTSREFIPELFSNKGIRTMTFDGLGRVTVSYRFSCSMLDKELGFEWLRNNELGGIIIETVNSSTLAATARSRLEEEGKDMPSDLFKTSSVPYTSITKA